MNKCLLYTALLATLIVAGCRKDKPSQPSVEPILAAAGGGVFITNEGNFQYGNASVSYFDFNTHQVIEDMYSSVNSTALGDVCQSLYLYNNKAYLVLNNSSKIEVVDATSFNRIATISNLHSPRYFLPVSNHKAYVTDLYAGKIHIINLFSNEKTGAIPCPGWTEEMILSYGKVYVTNKSKSFLYIIQTSNDAIIDSISISKGANAIRSDKYGRIWVSCSGGSGSMPGLYCINPIADTVEKSLLYTTAANSPWRLSINGSADTLYYLNQHVYRLSIESESLPTSAFIESEGRNFYGLGVDPTNGNIYLADAVDYVQRGWVYRYRSIGTPIDHFNAGIAPNHFYFN